MSHYSINININDNDFDKNGHIRADRIMQFFQGAAEGQVNSLGVGPDDLIKRDLIWVLTKMRVRFLHKIPSAGKYICSTFPAEMRRATFKRDYYINYAKDGPDPSKALVVGAGQWCIINFKTRKLEKTDVSFNIPENEIDLIEGIFPKISSEDSKFISKHKICEDDLDKNDHCNNAVYIKLAEIAIGKSIREDMYVNFASESRLGDMLNWFTEMQEEKTFVEGRKDNGEKIVQILFK